MRKIFDGKASLCFVKGWEGVNYVVVESPASSIGGKGGGGGRVGTEIPKQMELRYSPPA